MNNLLIVDLNHLIHRYGSRYFNGYISTTDVVNSINRSINEIKNYLNNPKVVIVADLQCPSRKEFYNELLNIQEDYKEGRQREDNWNTLDLAVRESLSKQYSYIRAFDYEADDIITSIVDFYKDSNINKYILTIDADILPLVDEKTSVFLFRNKKTEYTVGKYVLFTKDNFSKRVNILSSFSAKGITLNNFLLIKMLIGDKADNIPRVAKHTPKNISDFLKWSNIDKKYKWSYFENEESIKKELEKIILNPKEVTQALNNYKLMKMNSDLGGRRKPFTISSELLNEKGNHTFD